MDQHLFLLVLTGMLTVSFLAASDLFKRQRDGVDFNLGNRQIELIPLTLTFVATQLGGAAIFGTAHQAISHGLWAYSYPLGLALGFFVLSAGIGPRLRAMHVDTMAEIFEKHYKSKQLRIYTSLLVLGSLFFILCGIAVASRHFFAALGIDSLIPFFITWGIMIVYTTFGGLKAVVRTDMIQVLFVLFVFGLLTYNMHAEFQKVAFDAWSGNILPSSSSISWVKAVLMPTLFTVIGQDMGQRCFAARDPKTVGKATFLAGVILMIAGFVPVALGILARDSDLQGTARLFDTIERTSNLPKLATFFAVAAALAILSSADSLLCAMSGSLTSDFQKLLNLSSKGKKTLPIVVSILLALTAVAVSLLFDDILAVIGFAYSLSVLTLTTPIFYAAFGWKASEKVAKLSMGLSTVALILGTCLGWNQLELICLSLSIVPFILKEFL